MELDSAPLNIDQDVKIRRWTPDDLVPYREMVSANYDHLRWWLEYGGTVDDAVDEMNELVDSDGQSQILGGAIEHDGKLVGFIRLSPLDSQNKWISGDYWLDEYAQGNGVASRSLESLLTQAFEKHGINRVELRITRGNDSSVGVARRLGFQFDGWMRQAARTGENEFADAAIYSMLAGDWLGRFQTR